MLDSRPANSHFDDAAPVAAVMPCVGGLIVCLGHNRIEAREEIESQDVCNNGDTTDAVPLAAA